jgi:ELWxxDGT repeat protein
MRTDGTVAGTAPLDPDLTDGAWVNGGLQILDGVAYFAATNAATGTELWSSDGSAIGTGLLSDIVPGATSSTPVIHTVAGGNVYFTASASCGAPTERTRARFW